MAHVAAYSCQVLEAGVHLRGTPAGAGISSQAAEVAVQVAQSRYLFLDTLCIQRRGVCAAQSHGFCSRYSCFVHTPGSLEAVASGVRHLPHRVATSAAIMLAS